MNYLEWVRFVWNNIRKWWPSLSETNQQRGMDATSIFRRVVPIISDDKPDEREDALNAVFQALTTLREMHTLKVVSGTRQDNYHYAPSELANFQQSLSFSAYKINMSLSHEEAAHLDAIIRQSEKSTSTYALLKQLKVTEPESTFVWPGGNSLDDVVKQGLLESLSMKHLIWTDKSSTLGIAQYVQPTLSGVIRIEAK